ncbi:MAG: aminotransferase class IV [Planctomycetota bacterium]|jgi:branched-chain amino acid aminotransferase
MAEKVFLNDRLVDIDKACISVTDSGFLYGAGLFETLRSHHGVVFALRDHLDRLFYSAESLSISTSYDRGYITDAIYQVLSANELGDARLRLTLSNGPMAEPEQQRKPTLLITGTPLRVYPAEYYNKGVLVVLCPFRQNPSEPTFGHKTTSYFSRMIALNFAHQKRAAEALWFTVDNRLAEGCISNVFLARDSVLYTPPIRTPVLAGVARKTVCQIAVAEPIELVEKDLWIEDVLDADELFLTNVIMQVMPIVKVEKHTVGDGNVGSMAKRLKEKFDALIEQECQISKESQRADESESRNGK